MGFLKTAIIGAAVYAGVKYITKKDDLTGRSVLDDLMDKAPEWADKAKNYAKDLEGKIDSAPNGF